MIKNPLEDTEKILAWEKECEKRTKKLTATRVKVILKNGEKVWIYQDRIEDYKRRGLL